MSARPLEPPLLAVGAVVPAHDEPRVATHFWSARDPLRRRMLALADVATALVVCLSLAVFGPSLRAAAVALLFAPVWVVAAKLYGLYDRDHRSLRHLTVDELPVILVWTITCLAGLAVFLESTGLGGLTAAEVTHALVLVLAASLLLRSLARFAWRRLTPPERIAVVGSDGLADSVRRKLELFADMHASVVAEYPSIVTPGRAGRLPAADRIIVALETIDESLIADLVAACRRGNVKLSIVPPARGIFGTAAQLHHVADLPVIEYNTWDVSRSTLLLKRLLDLVIAGAMLVLTAPVFAAVYLAVRLSGPGPAFYVQTRAGLHGRPFSMFKFRTMRADAEALLPTLVRFDALEEPSFKLLADPRVTRVGRFLRRTSLDELPQLLNVLKGDMSLVGPRPEQVELVERYRSEHRVRLGVKPGLTGPMQVFGRGRLSFDERLAVERDYIENLSISRDLRILALTIPSVLQGRGAY
jgi:exopolysaccharide biosynthesis polyprenyl glycosylphosphotransferase